MDKYNSFTIPIKKQSTHHLTAVIIADSKCSSLIDLTNKTIIESQLDVLYSINKDVDIMYIGGAECATIKQKLPSIRVIENNKFKTTNDAENIRLAILNNIHDAMFIAKGNVVLNSIVTNRIIQHADNSTVVTKINSKKIGATVVDGKVTYFAYGLQYEWVPMLFFNKLGLQQLHKILFKEPISNHMTHELLNIYVDKHEMKAIIA